MLYTCELFSFLLLLNKLKNQLNTLLIIDCFLSTLLGSSPNNTYFLNASANHSSLVVKSPVIPYISATSLCNNSRSESVNKSKDTLWNASWYSVPLDNCVDNVIPSLLNVP